MGFEPFIPPKRLQEKPPEGSREDKVLSLAKLLHARGITSSMTDAKRLAEGMVDVERKVVKQESKAFTDAHATHADIADSTTHAHHPTAFSLDLPEPFTHFVAQAAAISHAGTRPIDIPSLHKEPMMYGREQPKPVAEVPHIHPHKQVFFQDAPPLSEARGFRPSATSPSTPRADVTEVFASDSGISVTQMSTTEDTVVIEERVLIRDEPEVVPEQSSQPMPEPISEPEKPPVVREDLAKKHGVDLFEMFKKKG